MPSHRLIHRCYNSGEVPDLINLWLLRLLAPLGCHREFVGEQGFHDDRKPEQKPKQDRKVKRFLKVGSETIEHRLYFKISMRWWKAITIMIARGDSTPAETETTVSPPNPVARYSSAHQKCNFAAVKRVHRAG
jgi:hypothetical protein